MSSDESASGHWFEPLAEHLDSAYLRYSFTHGTINEVDQMMELLEIESGDRVLDVGCGPGRHAYELAQRGVEVLGVDVSQRFVEIANTKAPKGATFERMDARRMSFEGEFDAAFSLCQGAFGLSAGPKADMDPVDPDGVVLECMAKAVRPGRRVALSAFSAYFQVRFLEEGDEFNVDLGVNHERTTLESPEDGQMIADMWTSCFTPRELRLLADKADLKVHGIWSVAPGDYDLRTPELTSPEFLLLAERRKPSELIPATLDEQDR